MKLVASSSDISKNSSLVFFSYFFFVLDALKVVSPFDGFSFPVLISYAVRNTWSSSTVSLLSFGLSAFMEILASYLIGKDLKIFCTIGFYESYSLVVMIELTTLSTL
jgi:hypothetical protein